MLVTLKLKDGGFLVLERVTGIKQYPTYLYFDGLTELPPGWKKSGIRRDQVAYLVVAEI